MQPDDGTPLDSDDLAFARAFVAAARWVFASTAWWMPNWYALRRECDEAEFARFLELISRAGYDRPWGQSTYRSLDLDGWRKLEALMTANPGHDWALVPKGEGPRATIDFPGATFAATMRPTPSAPGSVVIEDYDGRVMAEGDER